MAVTGRCGKTISAQQNFDGLHVRDKPGRSGYLVYLVHLVSLVCLVSLDQEGNSKVNYIARSRVGDQDYPNKLNEPDRPNRPNKQERLEAVSVSC